MPRLAGKSQGERGHPRVPSASRRSPMTYIQNIFLLTAAKARRIEAIARGTAASLRAARAWQIERDSAADAIISVGWRVYVQTISGRRCRRPLQRPMAWN